MGKLKKEISLHVLYRILILAAGIFGAYLIFQKTGLSGANWMFSLALRILFTAMVLLGADIWFREEEEELKYRKMILLILAAGCMLRIAYMLYTDCTVRAHDLGDLELGTAGKAGYLLLVITGKLPGSFQAQFYQQPFYYMAGAAVSGILNQILGRTDPHSLVDAAKTVSCLASCLMLFAVEAVLRELPIDRRGKLAGISLTAFTPVFFLTAGRVGEDAMTGLLMTLAVLATLQWKRSEDWQHALLLGLIYGIGMMTKISCCITGVFTCYILAGKIRKNGLRKYVFQIFTALIVCLPLGLWYSVRNAVLFGQPLNYVLPQAVEGPYYRGSISLVRRFLSLDFFNLMQSPYADVTYDFNLPAYLLKSELFGEFRYQVPIFLPVLLLFTSLFLSAAVLICGIRVLISRHRWEILLLVSVFLLFPFYAYFSYPFSCSMDFRYYMMITFAKTLMLGMLWTERNRICRALGRAEILFSVLSLLMFGFFPGM